VNLGPPPAHADEKKSPVAKELRRLAFKGVADELKDPSEDKEGERVGPQIMKEDAGHKNWYREQDGRDAQRMAGSVHWMLVAGGVLRDPLLAGAAAKHGEQIIHPDDCSSARLLAG
jgi:hypothetical protein